MCTIQLTYDKENAKAREMLATIYRSGLFYIVDDNEPQSTDAEDCPIPMDRNLSLDELESLVVADIRSICSVEDAVQV